MKSINTNTESVPFEIWSGEVCLRRMNTLYKVPQSVTWKHDLNERLKNKNFNQNI